MKWYEIRMKNGSAFNIIRKFQDLEMYYSKTQNLLKLDHKTICILWLKEVYIVFHLVFGVKYTFQTI